MSDRVINRKIAVIAAAVLVGLAVMAMRSQPVYAVNACGWGSGDGEMNDARLNVWNGKVMWCVDYVGRMVSRYYDDDIYYKGKMNMRWVPNWQYYLSHSKNYKKVCDVSDDSCDTSKLKPGDIIIFWRDLKTRRGYPHIALQGKKGMLMHHSYAGDPRGVRNARTVKYWLKMKGSWYVDGYIAYRPVAKKSAVNVRFRAGSSKQDAALRAALPMKGASVRLYTSKANRSKNRECKKKLAVSSKAHIFQTLKILRAVSPKFS